MGNGDVAHLLQDELLRRVGRNMLSFQHLESALRAIVPTLSAAGTVREIQSDLIQSKRRFKKASVGDLSRAFLEGFTKTEAQRRQ